MTFCAVSAEIPMNSEELFLSYRPLLFSIAYRMLGSAADAEDAVQETFIRWHRARQEGQEIHTPKGWLTTTLSRICLDQLGSARAKREEYIGPWLPEPLAGLVPDVAESIVDHDAISTAFMLILESLSPKERAVFLLHDVFAYDFAAIGKIVEESEAYCRQLARRARAHVLERRPRYAVDPAQQERLVHQFLNATNSGDMPALLSTLAADVTLVADGGGKVTAARQPVLGRDKVATFLVGLRKLPVPNIELRIATVNGERGMLTLSDGALVSVTTFEMDAHGIHTIYSVVNPDKLQRIAEALSLPIASPRLLTKDISGAIADRRRHDPS